MNYDYLSLMALLFGALYQDTRIEEGAFISQYDNWPRLLSYRYPHELISPDPSRLNLFYSFQQMNDILLCPIYGGFAQTGVYMYLKNNGDWHLLVPPGPPSLGGLSSQL